MHLTDMHDVDAFQLWLMQLMQILGLGYKQLPQCWERSSFFANKFGRLLLH
jgi:hypothetical protein